MIVQQHNKKNRHSINYQAVAAGSYFSSAWLLRVIQQLPAFPMNQLLDIGCGKKPYQNIFQAETYIGIDWPQSYHSQTEVDVYSDAMVLPFANRTFDAVLCTEVLEHLPEPRRAVMEFARVLKPGGHLILTVPFMHRIHEVPYDFFRYTPYALQRILEEAGFLVTQLTPRGGTSSVWLDLTTRTLGAFIKRLIWKIPLTEVIRQRIIKTIVFLPQWLIGSMIFWLHDRWSSFAQQIDSSVGYTLGYVVLAQKSNSVEAQPKK